MSVLIKDMKLPDKCRRCDAAFPDGVGWSCPLIKGRPIIDNQKGRRKDCPLAPVPPHGKLGDLDVLKETIEDLIEKHLHGYTKSTWDFVCELRSIISDAPTIITAEAAEEGSP